jgi:hypothetical protein
MSKNKKDTAFLLAFYYAQPSNKKITSQRGFMKNPDAMHQKEQVVVVRNLKNSDLDTASVILDVLNKKVVKCRSGNQASFDGLWAYYLKNYSDYLAPLDAILRPVESLEPSAVVSSTNDENKVTTAPTGTTIST